MIPVSAPWDKYDTRVRPVSSWISTMRVPAGIEVSMGIHGYTHEFLNFFFFFYK